MSKEPTINIATKAANKLISDIGKKYAISDSDLELLKGEMLLIIIDHHNALVEDMKTNLLPEINKIYEKYGYRK